MTNKIQYIEGEWAFGETITLCVNGVNVNRKVQFGTIGYTSTLYVNINGKRYARCDLPEFETKGETKIKEQRKTFNIFEGI